MNVFIYCMNNPNITGANTGFMAVLTSKDTQPPNRAFIEFPWLEAHIAFQITSRLYTNYTIMG